MYADLRNVSRHDQSDDSDSERRYPFKPTGHFLLDRTVEWMLGTRQRLRVLRAGSLGLAELHIELFERRFVGNRHG